MDIGGDRVSLAGNHRGTFASANSLLALILIDGIPAIRRLLPASFATNLWHLLVSSTCCCCPNYCRCVTTAALVVETT